MSEQVDWQALLEAARTERAGAEERARLVAQAKNQWQARAEAAEARIATLEAALRGIQQYVLAWGPTSGHDKALTEARMREISRLVRAPMSDARPVAEAGRGGSER